MVHTERCLEFTNLPREEPDRGNQDKPKEDDEAFESVRPFPIRNGQISAQRVHLRYSIDSPWVLKDFNLDIAAGEKVENQYFNFGWGNSFSFFCCFVSISPSPPPSRPAS